VVPVGTRVESAALQRLQLEYYQLLSCVAWKLNLRPYMGVDYDGSKDDELAPGPLPAPEELAPRHHKAGSGSGGGGGGGGGGGEGGGSGDENEPEAVNLLHEKSVVGMAWLMLLATSQDAV
jgi:hypothetical protein